MEYVIDTPEAAGGCGSGSCGCGSAAIDMSVPATATPEVRINGRRLHIGPGEDLETVRERAWGEVLRQEAVRQGLLAATLDKDADGNVVRKAGIMGVDGDPNDVAGALRLDERDLSLGVAFADALVLPGHGVRVANGFDLGQG